MTLRSCLLTPARLLALIGLVVLSACSSAPTSYHTLIPAQPITAPSDEVAEFQLQLMPVRIPLQADQPALVVRESDGRLRVLENARWASPPADEFHDALAFELEQRLGVRDLAGLAANPQQTLVVVRADVRRFDLLPGSHVALDVLWSLEASNQQQQHPTLTCASVIKQGATMQLDDLVLGHQRAISILATDIAETARRWVADRSAGCP